MESEQTQILNTEAAKTPVENATADDAVSCEQAKDIPEDAPDVGALMTRIGELEAALAEREQLAERMTRECEEFEKYFPEISLRSLPESVWTQVHAGVPLAAAYALYERGVQNERKKAEEREARAAACCVGVTHKAQDNYFSPAQVRAMSRREVRENYDRIFESMRHWQ